MTDPLRTLVAAALAAALAAVLAGGLWMLFGERLRAWARETEGEPWFQPMPMFGLALRPATWQGWLLALAVLLLTFTLGLLGAAGAFGPGHHPGG